MSKYYIFRYLNQIHGVSDPDPKVHESYLDVEPHLGALIGAQARFQANLILTPDPVFPPLANLTGTTVSFSTKNLFYYNLSFKGSGTQKQWPHELL